MQKYLKPADDKKIVRHPDTKKLLRKEGERVQLSSYWRRRIKDGSVVVASKPKKAEPVKLKKEENKKGGK